MLTGNQMNSEQFLESYLLSNLFTGLKKKSFSYFKKEKKRKLVDIKV